MQLSALRMQNVEVTEAMPVGDRSHVTFPVGELPVTVALQTVTEYAATEAGLHDTVTDVGVFSGVVLMDEVATVVVEVTV